MNDDRSSIAQRSPSYGRINRLRSRVKLTTWCVARRDEVFVQGLVQHQNQWLLYYGTADSLIGVASCPVTGVHAA
eukprot:2489269-Rhodomonas_salina.3